MDANESFDVRAALEAIDSLGYLSRSALPSLLSLLQDAPVEHPRRVCIRYRSIGEQLSREEKRVVGVRANAFLSRQAFDELTDLGKAKPLQAHELTLLRAEFTRIRKRKIALAEHPELGPFASFSHHRLTSKCHGCDRLRGFGRMEARWVQIMPPVDCEIDACNLGVYSHVDWAAYYLGDPS